MAHVWPLVQVELSTQPWYVPVQGRSFHTQNAAAFSTYTVLLFPGDHSKQDLHYRQKPLYFPIFTSNVWSCLLWSPVVVGVHNVMPGIYAEG